MFLFWYSTSVIHLVCSLGLSVTVLDVGFASHPSSVSELNIRLQAHRTWPPVECPSNRSTYFMVLYKNKGSNIGSIFLGSEAILSAMSTILHYIVFNRMLCSRSGYLVNGILPLAPNKIYMSSFYVSCQSKLFLYNKVFKNILCLFLCVQ